MQNAKRKFLIVGVLATAAVLCAVYLWRPGPVPQGQQPLLTLSPANAGEFQKAFDADASSPRLVLMLSPT